MHILLAVAAACLAAVLTLASAQPGLQLPAADQQKVKGIQEFCKTPAFRSRSCGWADKAEEALTRQCLDCGTIWCCNAGRASLPRTYQWQSNVYALAYGLPSLACQGKAVVRSVFKQNNMAWNRPGCADFRLRADFGDTLGKATEVVRCELALPSGGGSENDRALRSKEVNCRICNACGDGGGCPHVPGKWYSDSFVVDLGGCGASPAALARYGDGRAVLILNKGMKALLAKFEVCQAPGCFDPAYEAAKLRGAKRCVNGKC